MSCTDRLRFIKDNNDVKYMPFQYYDKLGIISLPAEGKRVLIKDWPNKTETVHPSYAHQNTCLLCGERSGITVIDFDLKNNGVSTFRKLVSINGMPDTPIVLTPTGIHVYFKYTPGLPSMNRLVDTSIPNGRIGIDVQNNGSIVIAPPSIINGKHYRFKRGYSFEDTRLAKMPAWLKKYIIDHIKPSTAKRSARK